MHENHSSWKVAGSRSFRPAAGFSTDWANGVSGTSNRRQQLMSTLWDQRTGNKSYQYFLQLFGNPREQSRDGIQLQILERSFQYEFKWPCFQPASLPSDLKLPISCLWKHFFNCSRGWGFVLQDFHFSFINLTIPFQCKEMTKHEREWVLKNIDHRKLQLQLRQNTTHFSLTWSNNRRSCRSDSPTHLLRQSAPFLIKKAILLSPWLHSLASARATSVFPVPGGP